MIREATRADVPRILAIYNDAILNTTAVYQYQVHTLADRLDWYEGKKAARLPLRVWEEQGEVCGYATYGPFRPWQAYKYTIEHSVYVDKDRRRRGIGKALLQELIRQAEQQGYATMVAGLAAANTGSIRLHVQLGFTPSGTIKKAGYKFGRWLDLVFYQLLLTGPAAPTED